MVCARARSDWAVAGVGAWNSLTTLVTAFFVDRVGRRPLVLIGLSMNVLGLGLVAAGYFFFESHKHVLVSMVIGGILLFIAGFEVGIGPLYFVILSEVFPVEIRSKHRTAPHRPSCHRTQIMILPDHPHV